MLSGQRGTHRIAVVLTAEQHWQLPEGGQVGTLVELALSHGAVTEDARGHDGPSVHVVRQGQPDRQWETTGDDRVAAIETV